MIDVGTLVMKIEADTKDFTKGFGTVKDTMAKAAKTAAIATTAIAGATAVVGSKLITMGADAEEMRNKYDVVFDGITDKVDSWSSEYSKAVGRSKYDTQEYLSNLADLQQGLGMTADESFDLSKNIVELGTDLASFNNVEDAVAIDAISKAMLGEADSAKQLGLLLNVDRVKDFAEAQGLVYAEMTDAAKAQLVYKLAVTQSQNAIGDAKRSASSYTNQMKALKSSVSDIATTLGMKLIPMATSVVTKFNESLTPAFERVSKWWKDNGSFIKETASKVFDKVKEVAVNVVTYYQEDLIPIFDKVKGWWSDHGDNVKEMASDAFNGIVDVAKGLWKYFSETLIPIFTSVVTYVVDHYPEIKATVKTVFDGIITAAEPLVAYINDELIVAFEEFSDFMNSDDFKGIAGVVEELGQSIIKSLGPSLLAISNLMIAVNEFKKVAQSGELFTAPFSGDNKKLTKENITNDINDLFGFTDESKAKRDAEGKKGGGVGEFALPTIKTNNPQVNYYMNITGNTISNDRDADALGNKFVNQLKKSGVK